MCKISKCSEQFSESRNSKAEIFFFLKKSVLVKQLIYNVVSVSSTQRSDSVIHTCIFFHYDLLQDIEYSSLFYTVGPCCLSILYVVLRISESDTTEVT